MDVLLAGIEAYLSSPTEAPDERYNEGGSSVTHVEGVEALVQHEHDIEDVEIYQTGSHPITSLPQQDTTKSPDATTTHPIVRSPAQRSSSPLSDLDCVSELNLQSLDQHPEKVRGQIYKKLFSQSLDIAKLAPPALCAYFPNLSDEIMDAYLQYCTFTATIWVNYDATDHQFFITTRRLGDCGKLVIGPQARRFLDRLDPYHSEIDSVHLNIGTPFQKLYVVQLKAAASTQGPKLRVRGHVLTEAEGHGDFVRFASYRLKSIHASGLNHGREVITLQDLDRFAALFVCKPEHEWLTECQMVFSKVWEMPRAGGGAWALTEKQIEEEKAKAAEESRRCFNICTASRSRWDYRYGSTRAWSQGALHTYE